MLVFCVWVVFPCPPERASVPGKPLAGPLSRGSEQLSGHLTPSVHVSCLGRTWSDRGGNKPWSQKGDFFSATLAQPRASRHGLCLEAFFFDGAKLPSLPQILLGGWRAAWSLLAGSALPGATHPGEATFAASQGRTCPVDD